MDALGFGIAALVAVWILTVPSPSVDSSPPRAPAQQLEVQLREQVWCSGTAEVRKCEVPTLGAVFERYNVPYEAQVATRMLYGRTEGEEGRCAALDHQFSLEQPVFLVYPTELPQDAPENC